MQHNSLLKKKLIGAVDAIYYAKMHDTELTPQYGSIDMINDNLLAILRALLTIYGYSV